MSTSRAIKPKRDDTQLPKWESTPERAPSILREDRPTVARMLAMVGLFLLVLGILAMLAPIWQRATIISPGLGFFIGSLGLCLILFHSFSERDYQFRRLYGIVGWSLIFTGLLLRCFAFKEAYQTWFFLCGVPALGIGLLVLIAALRNETEALFRTVSLTFIGAVGALMIVFSMYNGLRDGNTLPGDGALMMILGLIYVSSYIGLQDSNSERAYYAGLTLGMVGLLGFVAGLVRSTLPDYPSLVPSIIILLGALMILGLVFYRSGHSQVQDPNSDRNFYMILAVAVGPLIGVSGLFRFMRPDSNFMVPAGLILMGLSLLYIVIALGICVDRPIVVLARRELAAYFYSPVAYLIFIGQLIFAWLMFWFFVSQIEESQGVMFEPIIGNYIFSLIPVVVQMFFVPVLTMRLMSEEKRTGTLEVLLTAPVSEMSLVLGKFVAAWIFYMLLWLPWWLFLIALRYMGREEFDYRPILSFMVAMSAISAGFLSMGLFFSSLTSNQIIAAVFAFVGMMAHLAFYMVKFSSFVGQGGVLHEVLTYINYLDFWLDSLQGILAPRYFVFHLSVAVFFLFATIKVLEARKWR